MPALLAKYILCKILVSDSVLRKDFFYDVTTHNLLRLVHYYHLIAQADILANN